MKKTDMKAVLGGIIGRKINLQTLLTNIMRDRNKLILTIIVIVIILYFDFSFGLKSQIRAINTVNPKIERLKKDFKDIKLDLLEMQKQKPESETTDLQVKTLVAPDQASWLIEEISHMANQQDVRIYNIKPGRIPSALISKKRFSSEASIIFDLEVSGGYYQLTRFLSDLENHSVLFEIEELDIRGNDRDQFAHKVTLKLKTYFNL